MALIVLIVTRKKKPGAPYEAKRATLLTSSEQKLFGILRRAFPDKLIFTQVSINQMIQVNSAVRHQGFRRTLANRISGMSLDFVICHPDTSVMACIELDDKSHAIPRRQAADARKNIALKSANLRLLRISVKDIPDESRLKSMLAC